MLSKKAIRVIKSWIDANEKLKKINSYLYNNTELFEERYEQDYREELFRFFAGKIVRFTKDYNELMQLITYKEKCELEYIKITEE